MSFAGVWCDEDGNVKTVICCEASETHVESGEQLLSKRRSKTFKQGLEDAAAAKDLMGEVERSTKGRNKQSKALKKGLLTISGEAANLDSAAGSARVARFSPETGKWNELIVIEKYDLFVE